jgi:hypothetical protein
MKNPISVKDLLKSGLPDLARLKAAASEAERTFSAVQQALPDLLRPHVWGASVKDDGTLTVVVDSAGWATRIRYDAPELASDVARALARPISRLNLRVRPRTG